MQSGIRCRAARKNDVQAEIRKLLVTHCASLKKELEAVDASLVEITDPVSMVAKPDLTQSVVLIHKIKGSSGSIGFMDISAAAKRLETALRSAQDHGTIDDETRWEIIESHATLSSLIATAQPQDSRLYNIDPSLFKPGAAWSART
jgi:HPt (histidine-containing phosphotransfer) domain-containing protein